MTTTRRRHTHLAPLDPEHRIRPAAWVERWGVLADIEPDKPQRRAPWSTAEDWHRWNAWKVRLSHMDGGAPLAVPYFTGLAIERPTVEDIVTSLAYDAQTAGNYGPDAFEEWAADVGYDPDSRKAEATFRALLEQTRRMAEWLPPQAFRELVENVTE